MLKALNTPLKPLQALIAAVAAMAAIALYCLSYATLAGRAESPLEAIAWAVVNVLPWLAAFEIAKHVPRPAGKTAVLAAALIVSLAMQRLLPPAALPIPGWGWCRRRRQPEIRPRWRLWCSTTCRRGCGMLSSAPTGRPSPTRASASGAKPSRPIAAMCSRSAVAWTATPR